MTPLPPPPTPVWFGSYEYRVIPVERADPRLDGAEGITIFAEGLILYDASRPCRQAFDTVWHEFTHALDCAHDLKITSKSHRKNEETVATVHGRGWTQVLLDNPKLIPWLDFVTALIRSQQETA